MLRPGVLEADMASDLARVSEVLGVHVASVGAEGFHQRYGPHFGDEDERLNEGRLDEPWRSVVGPQTRGYLAICVPE